jgi:recombination protein RecA
LEVRRAETIKQGNDMVGNRTRVKVVKNKVAPPFRQADVDIMFGEGISKEGSALDIAAELEIVNKSGAWYSFEGDRLGQGRENAKLFLKENPEVFCKIENHIRLHHHLPLAPTDGFGGKEGVDLKEKSEKKTAKETQAGEGVAKLLEI